MRTPVIVILFCLLLCCGLLVAIALAPEVSGALGIAHPRISPMRAGGDGALRLAEIGLYAFAFHCLVLCCVVSFFALGVSQRRYDTRLYIWLAVILIINLAVWYLTYSSHQHYLRTGSTAFFLAFPIPTAWMLYGMGFCGAVFIAFYSIGFKKYVYNEEDAKTLAELVKEQQQQQPN